YSVPAERYIRGRICRDGACTVSTGHEIEPLHAIYFACLNRSNHKIKKRGLWKLLDRQEVYPDGYFSYFMIICFRKEYFYKNSF
ncbi:MAG: hypothetical protein LBS55_04750, partial [Prevotellaceae bacterium]|nr:hypothetical protein [Prevotellaceae bacterium]